MNHNRGIILIQEIGRMLESCNIQWWLTDGALLGLYRDGKLIEYDQDIDIGCFIDEYRLNFVEIFIDNGWSEINRFGTEKIGLEISFIKGNNKLDIFFFYRSQECFWHGAWQELYKRGKLIGRNMIQYSYTPFRLKKISFGSLDAIAPYPVEKYILEKYGENWKLPIKNWNWRFDPINSSKTKYIFYNYSKRIYELDLSNISTGSDIKSYNEKVYIKAINQGRILMAKGDSKRARNKFFKAAKAYPCRLTTYGYYFSTLLPNVIYNCMKEAWNIIQKTIHINI